MSKSIKLASDLSLDLDLLLRTRLLIQGGSGSGKSWLLRRLAEQLFGQVPVIIIDPEGEFASLREKFGYVLVGPGGETPADVRSAALVAHKLLELRASAVCDIYEMPPSQRHEWVKRFLEALIDAPKKLWHNYIIIVDEAHMFAPERGFGESVASDAVIGVATRGRKRGYGLVVATQRLGKLRKDVAAELQNSLIGLTTIDIDRARAVEAMGVTEKKAKDAFSHQLKTLGEGQFWAFGRALTVERKLVKILGVQTTHPKAGSAKHAAEPPPAPEKVKALLPKLADLPQQAEQKALTEAELKREVASLRAELSKAQRALKAPAPASSTGKPNEKQSATIAELKQQLVRHRRALEEAMKIIVKVKALDFSARGGEALEQAVTQAIKQVTVGIEKKVEALRGRVDGIQAAAVAAESAITKLLDEKIELSVVVQKTAPFTVQQAQPTRPPRATTNGSGGDSGLTPAKQKILNALAFFEGIGVAQADKTQLALIVGVSPTSGGYFNNLGALRSSGLIEYPSGGTVALTADGRAVASVDGVPETTEELHTAIRAKLPPAKWKILEALIGRYPNSVTKDALAESIGVSPTSGGYFNNLGSLRSLGLLSYPRPSEVAALPVLFLEGR